MAVGRAQGSNCCSCNYEPLHLLKLSVLMWMFVKDENLQLKPACEDCSVWEQFREAVTDSFYLSPHIESKQTWNSKKER